jgi:DNA-binding NtrC family response regulator
MASEKSNKTIVPLITQIARQCLLAGLSPRDGAGELRTEMIELKLQDNRGNQVRTARDLGMHRNTLSRDIQESTRLQGVLQNIRESAAGSRFARRKAN